MIQALPCPFCGERPVVTPFAEDVASGREGSAYGQVTCHFQDCPTFNVQFDHGVSVRDGELVADERGSEVYKEIAVRRWNAISGIAARAQEK